MIKKHFLIRAAVRATAFLRQELSRSTPVTWTETHFRRGRRMPLVHQGDGVLSRFFN